MSRRILCFRNNRRLASGLGLLILGLFAPLAQTEPEYDARAYIPTDDFREGEVRLVRQGDTIRLDILLYTRSVGRAFRELTRREEAAYPEDHPAFRSSRNCIDVLKEFRDHLRTRQDASGEDRCNARIVYQWSPGMGWVSLEDVTYRDLDSERVPETESPFRELILDPDYVLDHIRWMCRERLPDIDVEDLGTFIRPPPAT